MTVDQRIKAHFTTCFIALVVFRYLEKALDYKYTCNEIITGLREMNFLLLDDGVYVPTYTRTQFTGDLHKAFEFSTDKFVLKNILKFCSYNANINKKIFKQRDYREILYNSKCRI